MFTYLGGMRNDAEFFEQLYRGYEGEALVSAELFGMGLESFRLPGDFGFDLVVSNALAQTFKMEGATSGRFPWLVQVKSRRIKVSDMCRLGKSANGRYEAIMRYQISDLLWDRLRKAENAYLVLVVIIIGEMPWGQIPESDRKPSNLSTRHTGFVWFNHKDMNAIEPFLQPSTNAHREIELRYRTRPTGHLRKHFDAISKHIPPALAAERGKLEKRMPEYGEVLLKSGDYFSVWGQRGRSRKIADSHLSLEKMGSNQPSCFSDD